MRFALIGRTEWLYESGLALVEAFTVVRAGNPRAMPDQTQWQSLAQYFDDDTDFWDLWMRLEM